MNGTLLTFIGFSAITLLAIRGHLKRSAPAEPRHAGPKRCPRCGAPIPSGAAECPRCGVPLQVFDLVLAQIDTSASDENSGGPPRALVRSDLCVGCGSCVQACPEDGALTMSGKLALVDPTRCRGHGECVSACPMGAITVGHGAAMNRVVVPYVNANFETSVPGLYIVGELGGRALIKNAVNEGRVAGEHVARVANRRRAESGADTTEIADVAIVGGGPSGLSAGLVAHKANLDYVLLEQGTLADTVRKYPRHKILFAEPLTMPLYGDLWVSDASKESLLSVWEGVIARTGLRVQTGQQVKQIARERDCFVLTTDSAVHRARAVILALGRRGTPRRLGVPGEDLPTVFYDVAEMADFVGRRVLVVGGGDSAIESAIGLANQPGTTVTLSYRGEAFTRLKDRNRARLDEAVAAKRLTVLLSSNIREIRNDVAVVDVGGLTQIVPCDDVIVRIGGEPATALLEQLEVKMVTKVLAPPAAPGQVGSGDAA